MTLVADSISRRRIALFAGRDVDEGGRLLSPLHYLRQALHGKSELIEGRLGDAIRANPDAVILVDVVNLSEAESETLVKWVTKGGRLLRFSGPRMAAGGAGQTEDESLFPVRLRGGGRSLGGALSWGEARGLKPFAAGSPFFWSGDSVRGHDSRTAAGAAGPGTWPAGFLPNCRTAPPWSPPSRWARDR